MADDVKEPDHYTWHPVAECRYIVQQFSYNIGTAMAYLYRAMRKGTPIKDMRKAIEHIQFEIDLLENGPLPPAPNEASAQETEEREDIEGSLFVSTIGNMTDNELWHDEFLDWYKPEKWLSSRRAAAAFIADKIRELQKVSEREIERGVHFQRSVYYASGRINPHSAAARPPAEESSR